MVINLKIQQLRPMFCLPLSQCTKGFIRYLALNLIMIYASIRATLYVCDDVSRSTSEVHELHQSARSASLTFTSTQTMKMTMIDETMETLHWQFGLILSHFLLGRFEEAQTEERSSAVLWVCGGSKSCWDMISNNDALNTTPVSADILCPILRQKNIWWQNRGERPKKFQQKKKKPKNFSWNNRRCFSSNFNKLFESHMKINSNSLHCPEKMCVSFFIYFSYLNQHQATFSLLLIRLIANVTEKEGNECEVNSFGKFKLWLLQVKTSDSQHKKDATRLCYYFYLLFLVRSEDWKLSQTSLTPAR